MVIDEQWDIRAQYQPLSALQKPIDKGWEPFAVTPMTPGGAWIWMRRRRIQAAAWPALSPEVGNETKHGQ